MTDIQQNGCYITMLRGSQKIIKHCFLGTCEISRACQQNDHCGLESSIHYSKILKEYRDRYSFTNPYRQAQANFIIQKKQISDQRQKFFVRKVLKELHWTFYAQNLIKKLKQTEINTNNSFHQAQILKIYQNLNNDQQNQQQSSQKEVLAEKDSLKYAGVLGLINLFTFSFKQKCKQILQNSKMVGREYPFMQISSYITLLSCQIVEIRQLGFCYWTQCCQGQVEIKFQMLYETLFMEFSKNWAKKCQQNNKKDLNAFLKSFSASVGLWDEKTFKNRIADYNY